MYMQEVLEEWRGSNGVHLIGFQGVLDFSDVHFQGVLDSAHATRFSGGALCSVTAFGMQRNIRTTCQGIKRYKASGMQQSLGRCLALHCKVPFRNY
jgi:hypothetical protein